MLPLDFNTSIRAIREKCGSLGKATASDLSFLFPDLDIAIAEELCSECNFK
jgi:hypothetical protein